MATGHTENIDTRRGDAYQNLLAPAVFIPWAEDLIERAKPGPGTRVLDVACGTGVVTRLAAERTGSSGRVTGIDIDRGFLDMARSISPPRGVPIEWHEGSASEMPFGDGSFDLVLCQQGLQFFPDRPAALGEMRRVLRPGAKAVLSVWQEVQRCPGFHALSEALKRYAGPMAQKPLTFSLTDPDELAALAEGAGFADVRVEQAELPARFDSPERFAEIVAAAGPAIGRALAGLDEKSRADMLRDVSGALEKYRDTDGVVFPNASNILTGYA